MRFISAFPPLIVLSVVLVAGCSASAPTSEPRANPNIVLIDVDDLDLPLFEETLWAYEEIGRLRREGAYFENSFVVNSLCCPSRVTVQTGRYSHNTGVYDNDPPNGGYEVLEESGLTESALPVQLGKEGYDTFFTGKYANGFHAGMTPPPGWDYFRWTGGHIDDGDGDKDHGDQARLFAERAAKFIRSREGPMYLQIMPLAPHYPAVPEERYEDAFPGLKNPKTPAYNEEDVSDKPRYLAEQARVSDENAAKLDELARRQAQTMLSVDDLVGTVREELAREGELRNSYIIFTSDNGYHRGEHRAPTKAKGGKRLPYETDIRVPLVVWGGEDTALARGQARDEFVLNTDYAPTIADLAGADMPGADGSSFAPLLRGEDVPWRRRFLVEASAHNRIERPAYSAVRGQDGVYVDYESGRDEYYDLEADPYQLENLAPGFGEERIDTLQEELAALRECSGESCRVAEGFPTPQN